MRVLDPAVGEGLADPQGRGLDVAPAVSPQQGADRPSQLAMRPGQHPGQAGGAVKPAHGPPAVAGTQPTPKPL